MKIMDNQKSLFEKKDENRWLRLLSLKNKTPDYTEVMRFLLSHQHKIFCYISTRYKNFFTAITK